MRIKHWAGYGCVNAKMTHRVRNYPESERTMIIEVRGLHECGLDRSHDKYDCFNWLLKRFDKDVANLNDRCISKIDYNEHYDSEKNEDVATYTFHYSVGR